jgi:hypothetical protein
MCELAAHDINYGHAMRSMLSITALTAAPREKKQHATGEEGAMDAAYGMTLTEFIACMAEATSCAMALHLQRNDST